MIVVGVRPELGDAMIDSYKNMIEKGKLFKRGTLYDGFLAKFKVYVEPAQPEQVRKYTLGCARFYAGRNYNVVQLIYPTVEGVWPWEKDATKWFTGHQPMLGRSRPDRS